MKLKDMVSANKLAILLNKHYQTILQRIYKGKLVPDHTEYNPTRYYFTQEHADRLVSEE